MYTDALNELAEISQAAGKRQDYVQGGGGNTSVKLDDEMMAIKASGCRLMDVTPASGFAAVNYKSILRYHADTPKGVESKDYNKEVMDAAIASIRQVNGEPAKRPSVEAGFHALLGRCVIHTHAAYINVLMCSEEGCGKAVEMLQQAGIESLLIPYETPGYYLTEKIKEAMQTKTPDVILLGNHGVVVHEASAKKTIALHETVNLVVKSKHGLPDFPACSVEKAENGYASTNAWLLERTADRGLLETAFTAPLYPDQLVYLGGSGMDRPEGKIIVTDGAITYKAGEAEAQAMDETLSGVVYVIECIQSLGWKLKLMSEEAVKYISVWDSESYRKKQMAGK